MAERRKVSAGVAAGNTYMWAKQPCRAAAAGSMLLDADVLKPTKSEFGHSFFFFQLSPQLHRKKSFFSNGA